MNSRASRKVRILRRAWAFVVALLLAGLGWTGAAVAAPGEPARAASRPILDPADPSQRPPLPPELATPAPPVARAATPIAPAVAATSMAAPAATDSPTTWTAPAPPTAGVTDRDLDQAIEPVGCATCGGFHSQLDGPAFHAPMGCSDGSCIPGRQPCNLPASPCNTVVGQFFQNLYQCLCCPDPCYQPRWEPAANASFFADYARPRTVTRLRYDNLTNMTFPDRNQYFFKALPINTRKPFAPGGFRYRADPSARLQQVYLYQEVAGEKGSFFVEMPYRQVNPLFSPTQAGFGDLNFGMKSLLYDCELLQVSFQFRTYTPTGTPGLLGTGHFSLEPSILTSLKLTQNAYFQAQFGNWIPLAGNQNVAGGIFFWYLSYNQTLWRVTPDSPLIGTLEMTGWSFENGGYTRPLVTPNVPAVRHSGGGVTYFNIGPGLRWSICNTMDLGGAITFATGSSHWAEPWLRFEVRFLF